MIQAQLKRMEGLPWQLHRQFAAAAVSGVPHHRMVHMGTVHPDLMGATGIQLETQQRVITEPFLQRPMGCLLYTSDAADE